MFGFAGAGKIEIVWTKGGHGIKSTVLSLSIQKIRVGNRRALELNFILVERDESVGLMERERFQKNGVHDREQRGVCADSQCQGPFEKFSDSIANVRRRHVPR